MHDEYHEMTVKHLRVESGGHRFHKIQDIHTKQQHIDAMVESFWDSYNTYKKTNNKQDLSYNDLTKVVREACENFIEE